MFLSFLFNLKNTLHILRFLELVKRTLKFPHRNHLVQHMHSIIILIPSASDNTSPVLSKNSPPLPWTKVFINLLSVSIDGRKHDFSDRWSFSQL